MKAPFVGKATNRRTIPESPEPCQRDRAGVLCVVLAQAVALLGLSQSATATTAAQLCPGVANPCVITTEVAIAANSVIDLGDRGLRLSGQGQLRIPSGKLTLIATSLTVDASASIRTAGQRRDLPAADLQVRANTIAVAGRIDARGSPAGRVVLDAGDSLTISGEILGRAEASDTSASSVDLSGRVITLSGRFELIGGREDIGGDLVVAADESLIVSGSAVLDLSGGEGGSFDLYSDGTLRIDPNAQLDAKALTDGEDGGTVSITSIGPLTMRGKIAASARRGTEETGGGDGGMVTISADDAVDLFHGTASVDASGGAPDGIGGDIEIESSSSSIRSAAKLTASVADGEGLGGSIDIIASTSVVFLGSADARGGSSGGGDVDIDAGSDLSVSAGATIDASGLRSGSAGSVGLQAATVLTIAGTIHADGGSSGGTSGGTVTGRACEIVVQPSGVVTVLKASGRTSLTARARTQISGQLRAETASGRNELRYRAAGETPLISGAAVIVPTATLILDSTLIPCGPIPPTATPTTTPTEGPPTETPTETPTTAAATPSPTATPVAAQCPGDCDGNGRVDIAELVRAVSIALGRAPLVNCPAADRDGGGTVGINELIAAVAAALNGCPP